MKPSPLVAALALLSSTGALAQADSAAPDASTVTATTAPGVAETDANTIRLEKVTVNASADASSAGLSPSYPGGQVAKGARVGILGTRSVMETPFSTTAYTNELIRDKQAESVGDALQNDPTVTVARGFGNFQESYFVRGFLLGSDDTSYNGLFSVLPRQYIAAELFERVEVLRGASTFLTGATPGGDGVGGVINLLPKRATNTPITRLTVGTGSGPMGSVALDLGRRFGEGQAFGVRVNAVHRGGGTAVDNEGVGLDVASLGADWRTRRARLSADIGIQNNQLSQTRPSVTLGAVTRVPSPPEASQNFAQPWTYSNERDAFGSVRGEVDILPTALTTYVAYGHRTGQEANSLASFTVNNASSGAASTYRFDNARDDRVDTGAAGFRGTFATGPVQHEYVAEANWFRQEVDNAYAFYNFFAPGATNLYSPTAYPQGLFNAVSFAGNSLASPALNYRTTLRSYAVGDTLSAFNRRVLLTVGARHQRYDQENFAYDTGARSPDYKNTRNSPSVGLVLRPSKALSLYGNYIEGLTPGGFAPGFAAGAPVANVGQYYGAFVSRQAEAGLKFDTGRLGGSVALFTVRRPHSQVVNQVFTRGGQDRHQGVEASVYGLAARGLRVLGGFTVLDAEQQQTDNNANNGKRVIGTPRLFGSFGTEYDLPWLPDLTTEVRVQQFGSSYADDANTLKVGGWTRVDLGARYRAAIDEHAVVFRARVNNIADRNYWASVGGYPGAGYLVAAMPRTYLLDMQFDY